MTETKTQDEPTLPTKRKLDPPPEEAGAAGEESCFSGKARKIQSFNNDNERNSNSLPAEDGNTENKTLLKHSREDKQNDAAEEEDDDDDDDDEEEDDDEYDEDEEENGVATAVDRKGKGILIEEDEDDDGDNDGSSDDGSEMDGGDDDDSDLEDDPLAEVDLDNILPSRTRRKILKPGVFIRKQEEEHNNDDDSDDNDA